MEGVRNSIINWLIRNSAISEENRELYEYAVYSAELLILPVIMAIVIGWLAGSIINGVLLIIPFMLLKKYSGGYHAKKLSICMIISTILLTIMIRLSICDIKPVYMYIATCIAIIELCLVSPIQSDNKVLNEKEIRHYKKIAVIQLTVYSIVIICTSILSYFTVAKCMCLGIILASLYAGTVPGEWESSYTSLTTTYDDGEEDVSSDGPDIGTTQIRHTNWEYADGYSSTHKMIRNSLGYASDTLSY